MIYGHTDAMSLWYDWYRFYDTHIQLIKIGNTSDIATSLDSRCCDISDHSHKNNLTSDLFQLCFFLLVLAMMIY